MPFSLNFASSLLTNPSFKFKVEVSSLSPLCSSGKNDQQRKSDLYGEAKTHKVLCSAFVLLAGWRFVKIFGNMLCLLQSWKGQCTHFPIHRWFSSLGPVCRSVLRLTLKPGLFSSMLSSLSWLPLKMLLLFIYSTVSRLQSRCLRWTLLCAILSTCVPLCQPGRRGGGTERLEERRETMGRRRPQEESPLRWLRNHYFSR